jgi:hypothetical protein
MNIPGDELYTLLHAALKKRGEETLQRALYLALREAAVRQPFARLTNAGAADLCVPKYRQRGAGPAHARRLFAA